MKGKLILVAVAVAAIGVSYPRMSIADTAVRENPYIPDNMDEIAKHNRDEAARLFLVGQCKIYDAMSSLSTNSNSKIAEAQKNFADAADLFRIAAQMVKKDGDPKLALPRDNAVVAAAIKSLTDGRYGSAPTTFSEAITILATASDDMAKGVSDIRYNGDWPHDVQAMDRLRERAAASALIFTTVSTLAALGAS